MLKLRPNFVKHLFKKAYSSAPANETSSFDFGRERSMNLVQIIGRVGQDPKIGGTPIFNSVEDLTSIDKKKKVVMFSLATNEYNGLDEKGSVKTRVDWHRICVFSPRLQENTEKYVRQGDRLHVTGKLHYNLVADNNGLKRYIPSIVAEDIIFLNKHTEKEDQE